ncbi:MAG: 5-oxoprolinase subunit PxpB [Limisphaerales bacterium]
MPDDSVRIKVAGENALIVYLGNTLSSTVAGRVKQMSQQLSECLADQLVDLVPSYASILVIYRYDRISTDELRKHIEEFGKAASEPMMTEAGRLVTLPVWYGAEAGPDLKALAESNGLTPDEVVQRHHAREYRVYAIGFAPGFAYLGEVDEAIAWPRLATPRQHVPTGSVGIADRQTAVYPAESPGGWNLIGRCPVRIFDPMAAVPMPMAVGDRIQFEPISRTDYLELGGTP